MIPMIGLMIWAYGMARIFEVVTRKGDRAPNPVIIVLSIIMVLVMCYSCVELQLGGVKTGVTP